jgi:hypothetical protein
MAVLLRPKESKVLHKPEAGYEASRLLEGSFLLWKGWWLWLQDASELLHIRKAVPGLSALPGSRSRGLSVARMQALLCSPGSNVQGQTREKESHVPYLKHGLPANYTACCCIHFPLKHVWEGFLFSVFEIRSRSSPGWHWTQSSCLSLWSAGIQVCIIKPNCEDKILSWGVQLSGKVLA